jgi:hypothetical protein
MMRRPAIACAVVLISLALSRGVAEPRYAGTLLAAFGADVDVTPETPTPAAALTITYLDRKGSRVRTMATRTLTAADFGAPIALAISRNTSRVYVEVDCPVPVQIRVVQGTTIITEGFPGDARMVLDVLPAP